MNLRIGLFWGWILLASGAAAQTNAVVIQVEPVQPVVAKGAKADWKVTWKGGTNAPALTYLIRQDGGSKKIAEGGVVWQGREGWIDTMAKKPGALLLEVKGAGEKILGGVAVSPEEIGVSMPPPGDFDEFWRQGKEELEKIPLGTREERVASDKPGVEYKKFILDNIGGAKVYGHRARPEGEGKKLPALLILQWAGVYGLPKGNVTGPAANGWLALNLMALDLPLDREGAFYEKLKQGELKEYVAIGQEDKNTSTFRRMYLGCVRAIDYLATLPEWDGKTVVVMGQSQGGLQAFVAAALDSRVTAVIAGKPAGCDTMAKTAGRGFGWPYWQGRADKMDPPAAAKVMETSRYFDGAHFAARVKVPALVGLGLVDTTCPPTSVYSAIQALQGPKETVVFPTSGHKDEGETPRIWNPRRDAWLQALQKGEKPPVP